MLAHSAGEKDWRIRPFFPFILSQNTHPITASLRAHKDKFSSFPYSSLSPTVQSWSLKAMPPSGQAEEGNVDDVPPRFVRHDPAAEKHALATCKDLVVSMEWP